jgi:hypothetical protein
MRVFIKPLEDNQHIKPRHGERNNRVNTVTLLTILTLYPIVVWADLHTLIKPRTIF